MKWIKRIKAVITAISIMFAGMYGGQKEKGTRRFGIPGLAMLSSLWAGFRVKDLVLLALCPILLMGYGENSWLFNVLGQNETLCRIIYSFLLGIPFFVYGWNRGWTAIILLIIAFQVRAGSFGHISWFGDILIEDIARYGVLGILIAFNIYWRKK